MKKLAVLVLVVCLALCPTLAAHAEAAQNGEQVIAVIPKSLLYDYWQYVRIGTQKAGLDYGYTIDFQGTAVCHHSAYHALTGGNIAGQSDDFLHPVPLILFSYRSIPHFNCIDLAGCYN